MTTDSNNLGINVGDAIHHYVVKRITALENIHSVLYELEHNPTGAKHIHISNADKENTFSVAFKTVPEDSTGVAHILEHTVLCGSKRYPVRDPFFSMLKRSLSTFMNAFTSSDWTMYPFSTQNKIDFYNLLDVYLDAVFYPKLDPLSFKQEGHRLEIEARGGHPDRLVYKGVVYNEMKGAMSSPGQVMGQSLLTALYPDTTYSNNSGGDPAVIPSLTYSQLKAFHERHYHPSNANFYTYGNLPLKDHLAFIEDTVLSKFQKINPQTDVPMQPRWNSSKEATHFYALSSDEDPSKKSQVCVAWLTADVQDSFEVLVLGLLEQILLGNPGSPLRQALIDSGLGSALSDGTGFVSDTRDTLFACGLKDVKESDAQQIEAIIFDVFKKLVEKSIDKKLIDSAIHQLEFHRKEITNTPYPYGIKLLMFMTGVWLHGGDPVQSLKFEEHLKKIQEQIPHRLFENRIQKYFLENPHRVQLKLVPDQTIEQREQERVEKELEKLRFEITAEQLDEIQNDTVRLRKLQESPEDVSVLPTLELDEIPPKVHCVEESQGYSDSPARYYAQPTSGILYFTAASGVGSIPKHLLPWVSFFCYVGTKIGTAKRDYAEFAQIIDAFTGGIGISNHARIRYDSLGDCVPFLSFNGKSLNRNNNHLFEIIQELIYDFSFNDQERIKKLLLEYRAGLESSVVYSGHRYAISLASRNFSTAHALREIWNGIHQLRTLKIFTDSLSEDRIQQVSQYLTEIAKTIYNQANFEIALIGEEPVLEDSLSFTRSFKKGLTPEDALHTKFGFISPDIDVPDQLPREGWTTSSAVSFVAWVFKTVRMGHEDAAALSVISKILKSLYLHREIREKGGAYGGMAIYNPEDGLFSMVSYRDPNIAQTLKIFEEAGKFFQTSTISDQDVKEAILQVCASIDKPDPPGPAARRAFYRKLISLTDEARNQFKRQLVELKRKKVLAVIEKYFLNQTMMPGIAVISNEEKLNAENQIIDGEHLKLYKI